MSKSIDSQIVEKKNHKNANYYNFLELNYYKLDLFNQPADPSETFYI